MSTNSYPAVLDAARFKPRENAPYPFYLVQLTRNKELTLDGQLVSDALAWHLGQEPVSHVFLQTHGWNTPPDKAIKVPFGQFMAGMQDDPTMPKGPDFKPLFVAFTWQALPLKFLQTKDALERAELLGPAMAECNMEQDAEACEAATACASAARGAAPPELQERLRTLAAGSHTGLDADDTTAEADAIVSRAVAATAVPAGDIAETEDRTFQLPDCVANLLDPVQRLLFGRLIERGVATGHVLRGVMAKLMKARRAKYCLMANSLGAHVLAGALNERGDMPFRAHTVYFVQGACNRDWFSDRGRYKGVASQVAGPIVCTTSERDTMLSIVFEPFHGTAVGNDGFPEGCRMDMCSRDAAAPYEWGCGQWNTVDGTKFIDEGSGIAGGHGDFKEDETTMTYWSAINTDLPPDAYDYSKPATDGESHQQDASREGGGSKPGKGGFLGGLFGRFRNFGKK